MNAEPSIHVKSEPLDCNYEEPIDLDELQPPVECNNAVLTDLSNLQKEECTECKDRVDYECSACVCSVCSHKTSPEKRFRCVHCRKLFHDGCRINRNSNASEQWSCHKCEKSAPTDAPKDTDGNVIDKTVIKTEAEFDWNANSTMNGSEELDPSLDQSLMDVKNNIVDKVARRFMRKMHHASRTKECVTVPKTHYGPIPGVAVGTCWRFRLQVSEAGVHRPLVAGIHGRHSEGAYSIVLSGVYDDDQDFGDEFLYCGSGGRAKDPTKRYSAQITHQTLDNANRALALCCNAPLNDKDGAEAEDWRGGKPVRVTRNYRLRKHSAYAPEEGNRYDGIYKVVKYFPTVGKVGLIVWKFLMRRDDPEPAPWTEEGRKNIEQRNLARVIWPDEDDEGYQPLINVKEEPGISRKRRSTSSFDGYNFRDLDSCRFDIKPDLNALKAGLSPKSSGRPRQRRGLRGSNGAGSESDDEAGPPSIFNIASVKSVRHSYFTRTAALVKGSEAEALALALNPETVRVKPEPYELPDEVRPLILADTLNKRTWASLKTFLKKGEAEYRARVTAFFTCPCCKKLSKCPVTTPCEHNICLECLKDHFSKNVFSCPDCETDLGSAFEVVENENLAAALNILFPDADTKSSEDI